MYRLRADALELFCLSRGVTRFVSSLMSLKQVGDPVILSSTGLRPQTLERYTLLVESLLPDFPHPVEWGASFPFGCRVGTATLCAIARTRASDQTEIERQVVRQSRFYWYLGDFRAFDRPEHDDSPGHLLQFDEHFAPLYTSRLTPQRLRLFYRLCERIEAMEHPLTPANQTLIRADAGFFVAALRFADVRRGIFVSLRGMGWTIKRPTWRKAFAKRFPDFTP